MAILTVKYDKLNNAIMKYIAHKIPEYFYIIKIANKSVNNWGFAISWLNFAWEWVIKYLHQNEKLWLVLLRTLSLSLIVVGEEWL